MKLLDFFIRQTAKEVLVSEEVVDIVVKDMWAEVSIQTRQLTEIEVAGIGTFLPTPKKLQARINYYHKKLAESLSPATVTAASEANRMNDIIDRVDVLERRKNECDKKCVEKQA